ncbi:ABC transporter ATP-binding protein [uncultured Draconibacterium sp.]|uniref:ABC transporter ATP-binding protein n=1 Tax=uncultured Draconibacterium sp. TaxID=1573823 RepID=UPI0025D676A3|nr:ABC transporter ATP-binding protein [uncultured Draconibacterium sp.]
MIRCENIHLSYKNKLILSDFNLEVKKGENVCLSGASGKGKSSLLNMLQGYVIPQKGKVFIDGELVSATTVKNIRKKIIYVPQNIHLPVKNGNALIELLSTKSELSKTYHLLKQLGLSKDFLNQDFLKISGGQKQRIIIAICLSLPKEILLMDEPTASLDDKAINLLIKTIYELKNKTIVSASHNQHWAASCNRTIKL